MRFFEKTKDGGPESLVTGYFLIEIKSLFSIVLLHFPDSREAYHSHAFNALTLWLKGAVIEQYPDGDFYYWGIGNWKYTPRSLMHRIRPLPEAWAISFRGPWSKTWQEYKPAEDKTITLTHGRKIVGEA